MSARDGDRYAVVADKAGGRRGGAGEGILVGHVGSFGSLIWLIGEGDSQTELQLRFGGTEECLVD